MPCNQGKGSIADDMADIENLLGVSDGSDVVLYRKLEMYSVSAEGQIECRTNDMPAVIAWSPVSVTIPKGTDHRLASRLLRQLADLLSEQGVRKASPSKQKTKQQAK